MRNQRNVTKSAESLVATNHKQKREVIANSPFSIKLLNVAIQVFKTGGFNRSPTPPQDLIDDLRAKALLLSFLGAVKILHRPKAFAMSCPC